MTANCLVCNIEDTISHGGNNCFPVWEQNVPSMGMHWLLLHRPSGQIEWRVISLTA